MSKMTPMEASGPSGKKKKDDQAVTPFTIGMSSLVLLGDEALKPGAAFPFVKALMTVNARLRQLYPDSEERFDIVLMAENQDETRVKNSIKHHGLPTERFSVTGEKCLTELLKKFKIDLYLSDDSEQVQEAKVKGIAAATMYSPKNAIEPSDTQLRVAFDGDSVLFSDESEKVFSEKGLKAYLENERAKEDQPLNPGPLKCFLEALSKLQRRFHDKGMLKDCPIQTYLVTSRDAASAGFRALKTLRSWHLDMDEAYFLSGASKTPHLQVIRPHIFFDDQLRHIRGAADNGITAALVPSELVQGETH